MSAGGGRVRSFLAINLPRAMVAAAERLQEEMRRGVGAGIVRWVDPGNFHLTARFFGDLNPEELGRASRVVGAFDGSFEPARVRLGRLSAFPSPRKPEVIWLEVVSPAGELDALQRSIDEQLIGAGFGPADKPWRSHLTLGRVPRERRIPPDVARLWLGSGGLTADSTDDSIDAIALYRSELRPEGPRYTALKTALARGRRPAPA